jgi:hypothetical protein
VESLSRKMAMGDDRQAGPETQPHLHPGQSARDFGANEARQNHHGQRQDDALVETDQKGRDGRWDLDLEQDERGEAPMAWPSSRRSLGTWLMAKVVRRSIGGTP